MAPKWSVTLCDVVSYAMGVLYCVDSVDQQLLAYGVAVVCGCVLCIHVCGLLVLYKHGVCEWRCQHAT